MKRVSIGGWWLALIFLVSHAAFAEVPSIFPTWLKPETGVIKAVVHVN